MKKTVLIADDHPVYLLGLRTLLQTRQDRYQIVHEALSADEVMDKLAQLPVDIIITDLSMPGDRFPDGLTMVQTLTRHYPESMVVVVTMITNPELLASLRRCGVHAVLSKTTLSTNLIQSLHSTSQGLIAPVKPEVQLTQREIEVLRLLLRGLTVNQISAQLKRTKQTISTQKISAMRKLGASSDFELFQYAQSLGLGS
ncbi:response regulator transcription factor [Pantoea sp.]|uniref:response regulator transcription factor n=1 Tax=Pantoea sp. TaxID=69393 RepID=UPI0028B237E7|nr:response regulator transcription factor [Pantoea sp.]